MNCPSPFFPRMEHGPMNTDPRSGYARAGRAVLLLAIALSASACARRAPEVVAQIPDNYTERHPIQIGDTQATLDVFLAPNAGLDHRQATDVKDFVESYRKVGKGPLVASLPPGAPAGSVQHTLGEIRRLAASKGLAPGAIRVTQGGQTHPTAASVRLSFARLDARLVSKCGQWPHDLSGGPSLQSWENRPYYNLGCSYQSMVAAQVADPIDLIRSRPESAIDIGKRLEDIEAVRENRDPTTKWPSDQVRINSSIQ